MRNKLFSKRDYEGLDEISKKELSEYRKQLAQDLREKRNRIKDNFKQGKYKPNPNIVSDEQMRSTMERGLHDIAYTDAIGQAIKDSANKKLSILKKQSDRILEEKAIKNKEANIKKLKKLGKYSLGALAIAGTAYGGKKLYDHYKNK